MLRFKQLMEMPYLLNNWKKKGDDAGLAMPSATKIGEMGNYDIKHWNHGDIHTYSLYHKDTGKVHMEIHGREHPYDPNRLRINGLNGTHESEIKAHQFYHHLVIHHGLTLHSDDTQSEGGLKTWHKLSTEYPDIRVRHISGDEHELPFDKTNFRKNYIGLGRPGDPRLGRSYFEARPGYMTAGKK